MAAHLAGIENLTPERVKFIVPDAKQFKELREAFSEPWLFADQLDRLFMAAPTVSLTDGPARKRARCDSVDNADGLSQQADDDLDAHEPVSPGTLGEDVPEDDTSRFEESMKLEGRISGIERLLFIKTTDLVTPAIGMAYPPLCVLGLYMLCYCVW